jgi:hypothetical protein
VSADLLHTWAGLIFAGRRGCRLALEWAPAHLWRIETTDTMKIQRCATCRYERVCWDGKDTPSWWNWARSLAEEKIEEHVQENAKSEQNDTEAEPEEVAEEESALENVKGKKKRRRN